MCEQLLFVQGPPGSGKSSLARQFLDAREHVDLHGRALRFLPVGKYVREVLNGERPSIYAEEIRQQGQVIATMQLPTHQLVYSIFEDVVTHLEDGTTIVDGFPREPEMVLLLQDAVSRHKVDILGNIIIDVSDELAITRQIERTSIDGHPVHDEELARKRVHEYRAVTEQTALRVCDIWGGFHVSNEGAITTSYKNFASSALSLMR